MKKLSTIALSLAWASLAVAAPAATPKAPVVAPPAAAVPALPAPVLPTPSLAVQVLEKDRVAAMFKKGGPLLETTGYKVVAGHRDEPGPAEVHTGDTDIIYVLVGSATLVTGGTLVDAKPKSPGELRGPSIKDGASRTISVGDVIIIPKGIPHWFSAPLTKPFDYLVVKVP